MGKQKERYLHDVDWEDPEFQRYSGYWLNRFNDFGPSTMMPNLWDTHIGNLYLAGKDFMTNRSRYGVYFTHNEQEKDKILKLKANICDEEGLSIYL